MADSTDSKLPEPIPASDPPKPVSTPASEPIMIPSAAAHAATIIPPSTPPVVQTKVSIAADTVFTGELLRQVRESQRITLKEISERTRISVTNLSALENEKYEDLPNARVYVRGFVRCLAVEIGLDRDHVSRTYVPRWERWFADQQIAANGRSGR